MAIFYEKSDKLPRRMMARVSIIHAHLLELRTHMLRIMTNECRTNDTDGAHFGQDGRAGDAHIKWLLDATQTLLQGE